MTADPIRQDCGRETMVEPSGRCDVSLEVAVTTDRRDPLVQAGALPAEPWPNSSKGRSEEHTSELQSRPHLVCRLLLEKKKKKKRRHRFKKKKKKKNTKKRKQIK